jgi:hypothetical protein
MPGGRDRYSKNLKTAYGPRSLPKVAEADSDCVAEAVAKVIRLGALDFTTIPSLNRMLMLILKPALGLHPRACERHRTREVRLTSPTLLSA